MKTTLFKILWLKEKKYWKRTVEMLKKFDSAWSKWTLGLIVTILVTLFHYAFALMHLLFESILFIFARKRFKHNLQVMMLKI
ncbi:MAG: hypothetical protein ACOC22_00070 [bacterium]